MHDAFRLGILGGFGPLPTAHLYMRLSCILNPRPEIIVVSPAMSKEQERMLLRHEVNAATEETIRESLNKLNRMSLDSTTVPSITVASLIRKCGMRLNTVSNWFDAINKAVLARSPRRIGIIATNAVIEHSELINGFHKIGLSVVCAPHIQDQFHEWVLSCCQLGMPITPHDHLISKYSDFFKEKEIDLCVLACTEACLPDACFGRIHSNVINVLSVLETLILSRIKQCVNNPPHNTSE